MNIEEGKQIGSFQVADYPSKPVASPGPGYPVSEAAPAVREPDRLFCWGLGVGWFLFILGFILGTIPWYVGAIMLFCVKRKHYNREKPGYIACAIFAVIGTVLIIVAVTIASRHHSEED